MWFAEFKDLLIDSHIWAAGFKLYNVTNIVNVFLNHCIFIKA